MTDDFYVGYLPKAPSGLALVMRATVLALVIGAMVFALILVSAQEPFAASAFEYGKYQTLTGIVELRPYPSLLVAQPGNTNGIANYSRYLLVAPGKHGADGLVAQFAGRQVTLRGSLIYRGGQTMVEVQPASIASTDPSPPPSTEGFRDLGEATLTGEIVDTKCYLGVMNPGSGKVHRDCAARCISGGIPPAFLARDQAGRQELYLLTDSKGRALHRELISQVGENITMRGRIAQIGETHYLRVTEKVK